MSSFFTVPGAQKKRKQAPTAADGPKKRFAGTGKPSGKATKAPPKAAPQNRRQERDDESISGSDSEDDDVVADDDEAQESGSDSEKEGETAAEKRLRLAERYLERVRQQEEMTVGFDATDVDRDIIADRLKEDVAVSKGKVFRQLADELATDKASHCLFRADTLTTTNIATCAPFCYTASKDRTIIKWRIQDLPKYQYPQKTKKKPKKQAPPRKRPEKVAVIKPSKSKDKDFQGHVAGEILCIAASQDGKFLVTGGTDRRLCIYDANTMKPLKAWTHHRDAVTALVFRRGSNQLYSASKDRTIKVWSLDDMAYVETLFGHADQVVNLDALALERCISVGARDRTARLWKVVEETQLVFRGGGAVDKRRLPNIDPRSLAVEGSMDCVSMIDEELFVTGSDNGSIALWSLTKKKPLYIMPQAHGLDPALKPEEISAEEVPDASIVPPPQPRWITALRAVPYSDVIFSGSWDGIVKVWKLSEDKKSLQPVGTLCEPSSRDSPEFNGVSEDSDDQKKTNGHQIGREPWVTKGVINDLSVFERGDRGKDGLCVVAALGKDHRLGKWKKVQGGKNGAVVFEIPKLGKSVVTNGDKASQ
ncbi:WD40-repeat-containing domain protein [Pestalotiopsis sp. NC0098]|nr:WD40-repeat-containing domain protein [Pestalotiopsis sp. NC0098]